MRTAAIFSHNMVLQREKPIRIWGDADSGEQICITLGDCSVSVIARNNRWLAILPPMSAAVGLTMTIRGAVDTITFTNIAIGEVWLCGGQSNMEFEIHSEQNGEALLQTLSPDCGVRFYYTPKQRIKDEQFEAIERNTCWTEASPKDSRAWSAVGLYFALQISKALDVTVGLIGCNWGGTSACAWIPRETLEEHPALYPYLEDYDAAMKGKTMQEHIREYDEYIVYQDAWNLRCGECYAKEPGCSWDRVLEVCGESRYPGPMGPKNEYRPGGLYETMLSRVCPYTLRGFLYYQGESDDHRPDTYALLLSALIGKWRSDWQDPALPFLNVQLPMFRYRHDPDYQHWCRIREAQADVYCTLKHTGLAVLADCGELDNIHPIEKKTVGERLALQALYEVYGIISQEDACAPMYRDHYVIGNTMILRIDNAAHGFVLHGEPAGFTLAGEDRCFYPAKAVLAEGQIRLTAAEVSTPCYARYAWSNFTTVHIYGKNGLPLMPFRTHRTDTV